jgi:hypothetical protein
MPRLLQLFGSYTEKSEEMWDAEFLQIQTDSKAFANQGQF